MRGGYRLLGGSRVEIGHLGNFDAGGWVRYGEAVVAPDPSAIDVSVTLQQRFVVQAG